MCRRALPNYPMTRDLMHANNRQVRGTVRWQLGVANVAEPSATGVTTENLSQLWNVNEFVKFFSNRPRIPYPRPAITSSPLFHSNFKRTNASSKVHSC